LNDVTLRIVLIGFYALSAIIPLVVGLLRFKRLDKGLRLLVLLLFVTLIFDSYSTYQAQYLSQENAMVMNFYNPIELTLIALMFSAWHRLALIRNILFVSIPAFVIFWAVSIFTIENQNHLDNVVLTVESALVVVFAVMTMFTALKNDQIPVLKNPVFWVCSAFVLYFAGNIFLFALTPQLMAAKSEEAMRNIWILHTSLNLIKNLLFLGGILAWTRSSYSSAEPLSS
jgi:hypothetical protein